VFDCTEELVFAAVVAGAQRRWVPVMNVAALAHSRRNRSGIPESLNFLSRLPLKCHGCTRALESYAGAGQYSCWIAVVHAKFRGSEAAMVLRMVHPENTELPGKGDIFATCDIVA
jgi:hypothetical protein